MKVISISKLDEKFDQYDISTETENFYIKVGNEYVLIHNSPAVFTGINPENGKFFVAKKGIFNKNAKLYYSHQDIDADTSGDLATKLKVAFTECSKLGIKGIYQGDILYTKADLKKERIENEDFITFHPNTILYAVPSNSSLGKQITRTNIGIAWHTTYTGNSIESLSASFGKNITNQFKKNSSSWNVDATVEDISGPAMFTDSEKKSFDLLLSTIGKTFRTVPSKTLNAIHGDPDLLKLVHIYNNQKVKAGERISNVKAHVDGLYKFIYDRYQKEIDAKKTDKGKEKWSTDRNKVLEFFSTHPKSEIETIFQLSVLIGDAKLLLVNKLNKVGGIKTLLKTKDGFKVTGQEGFVAIRGDDAVKLVDRLEFSRANFSPDVLKGWTK